MTWAADHWFAIVLLILYTGVLLRNAWVGSRASTGMAGYYVGNRNMGGIAIGISFYATFASTNSYIGHAGKGYFYGVPWFFLAASLIVFTYLSWRFVGPRLRAFAANFDALTLPDYLGTRFLGADDSERHPLRYVAALVIVFASLLYLIAIFKGAGHLFEQFFSISYEAAVLVTLAIVVVYTSIGGFVSVVRTDVVQGILMVVGAVMMFYFVTDAAGGVAVVAELAEQPQKAHLFEFNGGIPFAIVVGISLSGALKLIVDPRQLSRYYALKNEQEAKRGMWIAILGLLIVQACIFPVGIYAHFLLEGVTDSDLIVPTLVVDPAVFPYWAGDFLMVAIVAAGMSSMDSVLLVAASTLFKNLLRPFFRTDREVQWTRMAVVGLAVVAALLAFKPPGDIVEITIFSGSLYAVCFLPAVLLGLHLQRGTATAVLASMGVGVMTLIGWMICGLRENMHEVFPGLVASVAVYWVISLRAEPVNPQLPDTSAPESPVLR